MSVKNENAAGNESIVLERPEAGGVYASLFEKINLNPVSELSALDNGYRASGGRINRFRHRSAGRGGRFCYTRHRAELRKPDNKIHTTIFIWAGRNRVRRSHSLYGK